MRAEVGIAEGIGDEVGSTEGFRDGGEVEVGFKDNGGVIEGTSEGLVSKTGESVGCMVGGSNHLQYPFP